MKNIDRLSKNPRGSSPPFLESEGWVEDGAGGSHWVKMPTVILQQQGKSLNGSHDQEQSSLLQTGAERRWEDDGGNSLLPAK